MMLRASMLRMSALVSISFAALAFAGCAVEPAPDPAPEAVGATHDAYITPDPCPDATACDDACSSVDPDLYGHCGPNNTCICRPPPPTRGGGGGGSVCYINWNVGWGEWECIPYQ